MESLEGLEILLLFVFIPFAAIVWFSYYTSVFSIDKMLYQPIDRWLLILTPLLCAGGLFWVLTTLGDPYVRSDGTYLLLYWSWGIAWLAGSKWFLLFLGFSVRDDGLERRNTAAAIAICGAFIGLIATYAGGNIGSGPGWWIVLLSVCVSTGAFLIGWFLLEFFTQISETITIERNFDAGMRLAAFLIVMGVILGRAVSGDWVDMNDFIVAFVSRGWVVIPLLIIAIVIENASRPTVEQPRPTGIIYSILPAAAYFVIFVVGMLFNAPKIPR